MAASAILVADTISEIIERMSSLRICGQNITKKITPHLTILKEICPKLDLNDAETKKWLGELTNVVTDLFYLVDDLSADAALLQKQSYKSFFSACNLTPMLQLKAIEKQLREVASESSLNKVQTLTPMSSNQDSDMLRHYNELNLDSLRLKQCFAYCAFIFSAETAVKSETLIRLWMAEGFLGPVPNSSSSSEPEDLGHACIEEFRHKKIFIVHDNDDDGDNDDEDEDEDEDEEEDEDEDDDEIITMNPSMQDLAAHAAGDNYLHLSLELDPLKDVPNRVQRVAVHDELDISNAILTPLFESAKHLRTFLLPLGWYELESWFAHEVKLNWSARDAICSRFKRLRVLTLNDLGMGNLPASIGGLKSLRYLDLSHNYMTKLPHSVGELKCLQTLLLSQCYELKELPDGTNCFASLRHLDLDDCLNLMHMPYALSKLTWLRTLTHFVASTRNGLGELVHLNNLRGELEISDLMRVKLKGSKSCFYLKEKEHLEGLTLRWNFERDRGEEEEKDQNQFLLQLEPHTNLERLSVIGYKGNQFAGWLSSLKNLVEISLYRCSKCQSLPSLGQMQGLKKLTLVRLDSLQFIANQDDGSKEWGLEQVHISHCPKLTSWWEKATPNEAMFSSIKELVVEYCPEFASMPLFPKLDKKLVLDCSNMQPFQKTLRVVGSGYSPPLSSLIHLTIRGCKDLKSITGWKHLKRLDELCISNCTNIDLPIEEWEGMEFLDRLVIENIPDLHSLSKGILETLPDLVSLEIRSCPELKTLDAGDFRIFLIVEDCPKVESLPKTMSLTTENCPLLEKKLQQQQQQPQQERQQQQQQEEQQPQQQ